MVAKMMEGFLVSRSNHETEFDRRCRESVVKLQKDVAQTVWAIGAEGRRNTRIATAFLSIIAVTALAPMLATVTVILYKVYFS